MLCKKLGDVPIQVIVRGYITAKRLVLPGESGYSLEIRLPEGLVGS